MAVRAELILPLGDSVVAARRDAGGECRRLLLRGNAEWVAPMDRGLAASDPEGRELKARFAPVIAVSSPASNSALIL
jgi:hypothetical protein